MYSMVMYDIAVWFRQVSNNNTDNDNDNDNDDDDDDDNTTNNNIYIGWLHQF